MGSVTDQGPSSWHWNTKTQLAYFLDHLNNLCEKIQFTMEIEEENQLPFLDALVKRNENTLTTSVFHKKTHMDWYIHFRSHHHPQIKMSVVSCLKSRAERACPGDGLKEELNHLSRVFQANRYPHTVTAGVLNKKRRAPITTSTEGQVKLSATCLTLKNQLISISIYIYNIYIYIHKHDYTHMCIIVVFRW